MRILILSDINSIHTRRWVTALSLRGHQILLIGLLQGDTSKYESLPNVFVYSCGYTLKNKSRLSQWMKGKFQYLGAVKVVRKKIKEFHPDILHAHYASSYGLIGALAGFHPYILSVWGSDVYEYPNAGSVYKNLLQYSLSQADKLLSTSHCMAQEAAKYTDKPFEITPFGVDIKQFKHYEAAREADFVVGNVKTLKPIYGIDILVRAFALLCENNKGKNIILKIAGTGPQHDELVNLCRALGISDKVQFLGYIDNGLLPQLYAQFDVSVSLSRSESFGVVAVEAMACQCPVVTSDAEGFKEVVEDEVTGFVVPANSPEKAAEALQKFIDTPSLKETMGEAARQRVIRLYDWEKNVDTMDAVYQQFK